MPNAAVQRSDVRLAALIVLAVTLWRIGTLAFDETELWVDEVQYWLWGQHLDWGYFSKPPMIAFWLRAVTDLAGSDAPFWIRMSGSILHAVTAGLIGLTAARLFDARIGASAAILYVTLPFVTLGSWLISTDTVMLPFYALALYAYLRLCEARSVPWAVTFGAALGLGLLGKYAAIYLPIGLVIAALLIPTARIALRDAAISAVVTLVTLAPNLAWNIGTGGTTLRHIAEDNAKVGETEFDLVRAAEFLASQAVVFGPLPFAALFAALWLLIRRRAPGNSGLLVILSFSVLVLLSVQAARAGANANWAVTAYVAGTVLATAILIRTRWLLALSLAFNMIFVLALPVAYMNAETLRLPNGKLLAARYLGSEALSTAIAGAANAEGLSVVVAARRGVLADLFHRFHDGPFELYAPRPDGRPHNYYEQTFPLPDSLTGDVLYATSGPAPCPDATVVGDHAPSDGNYAGLVFTFYRTPAACLRP